MSHLFETLQNTAWGILQATYSLWLQMGIYLVFGFAVAGILSRFLKRETIARHLGGNSFASVCKAAIFGVPLPLCSCGVLPVGLSLLKRGASRGATTAFLISTPETGVDSIVVTYGMLGPLGPASPLYAPLPLFSVESSEAARSRGSTGAMSAMPPVPRLRSRRPHRRLAVARRGGRAVRPRKCPMPTNTPRSGNT